jgi:hypothetical protein
MAQVTRGPAGGVITGWIEVKTLQRNKSPIRRARTTTAGRCENIARRALKGVPLQRLQRCGELDDQIFKIEIRRCCHGTTSTLMV